MKRLFLIVLLALLPLQAGWAAGWCVISDDAPVTAAVTDMGDAESPLKSPLESGCSAACVSACEVQSLDSCLSVLRWSEQSHSFPASLNQLNYQSPILDGLIRPK